MVKTADMTIVEIYSRFKECGRVTTDSRGVKGGEIFFALKGENFDGNEYAAKALEAGASYAVVDSDSAIACSDDPRLIRVENTLRTLQELARWHRSMTFVDGKPLTVIALTGTNGKTTTKELVREVLSVRYRVTATEGNLNNSIGVPLTLLRIDPQTQIAVVEMGASHPGDIKELVDIALPNYGLITNVGKAHLLGFGSFEGVMNTKGELYDYLRRTSDKVFLNVDNVHLCRMAAERNLQSDPERPYSLVIPYGLSLSNVEVLPSSAEYPYLRMSFPVDGEKAPFVLNTNLVGTYNADNVMAALAVGAQFGIGFKEAADAVSAYVPSNNRSQMVKTGRNTLIVDAYNANPTSMEAALRNFADIEAESKVVMLGDMLELGEDSIQLHESVLDICAGMNLKEVCLVGSELGKAMASLPGTARFRWFEDSEKLAAWAESENLSGSVILVKGSRGIRMEKVIPVL